jgi:putative membrane protein insertion efficiency factor
MKMLVKMIKLYQSTPLESHNHCRFYPTCSNYAIESINEYGNIKGSYLAFKRILRCNPFNKHYGYDPVIKKGEKE